MPKQLKIASIFFSFSLLVFSFPAHAVAQETESTITAIPPRAEVTINPGETVELELKLRNESDTTRTFTVRLDDVIVTDDIGTPIPVTEDVSGRWSAKSWISAPKLIPVDGDSTYIYKIKITAPKNALPGGHYAMLTYKPDADFLPGGLKKTGSIIGHSTGSIIYITVPGDITENAVIRNFTAPQFNEFGPVEFTGSVDNLSDVHVNPTGTIAIFNMFGRNVATIDASTGNIFPGASRGFQSSWNRKWGIGLYKADLNLVYGPSSQVLRQSISFWLFPIRLIIAILMVIISILVIALLIKKQLTKREQRLQREVEKLKKEVEVAHHQAENQPPTTPEMPQ